MNKRILTIIGARPQFIKASVVSRAIVKTEGLEEIVLHTGQHFDKNMSEIFFDQLQIPAPAYQLDINGGRHGVMTGRMMEQIEEVAIDQEPDGMLVYGDTNSTLAGALVAAKLHIPVAHVESGLRSRNKRMPEEVNRILTDHISDILFCPTDISLENLRIEGFEHGSAKIFKVGDVMQDSVYLFEGMAVPPAGLDNKKDFVLATLHRAENTDDPERLKNIVNAINKVNDCIAEVIIPLHPRTKAAIEKLDLKLNVTIVDPVGYLAMIWLLKKCSLVLTDSGGLQKEAFFFRKSCVTMRDQTEWLELVEIGVNVLVGANTEKILDACRKNNARTVEDDGRLYGGGRAALKIAKILREI